MKIYIYDESSDTIVSSEAELDIKTGAISNVVYLAPHEVFNKTKDIEPFQGPDYENSYGEILVNGNKLNGSIEFKINTETYNYVIPDSELKKIQEELKKISIDTSNNKLYKKTK